MHKITKMHFDAIISDLLVNSPCWENQKVGGSPCGYDGRLCAECSKKIEAAKVIARMVKTVEMIRSTGKALLATNSGEIYEKNALWAALDTPYFDDGFIE